MKRLFYIIAVLFAFSQSNIAQIQIEEYGKAGTLRTYEKNVNSIYWIEDGYYFAAWDYDCAKYNLVGEISPILLKFYFLFGCGDLELNPTITAR